MEICQCQRYREAVEKYQFFSLGTLHSLVPKIPVPENSCIMWKCNKANHDDLRPNKPILISPKPHETEEKTCDETLESKWIPVMPGVISQKAVNESKPLNCPF